MGKEIIKIRPGEKIKGLEIKMGEQFYGEVSGVVNQIYLNGEKKPLIGPGGEKLTRDLPAGIHGGDKNVPGVTIANWHYGDLRVGNAFLSEDEKGAYIGLV